MPANITYGEKSKKHGMHLRVMIVGEIESLVSKPVFGDDGELLYRQMTVIVKAEVGPDDDRKWRGML